MNTMLLTMLPFLVVLACVLYRRRQAANCPDCGDALPPFVSLFLKTRRMWRAGGYLCRRCGCEADLAGRKVTADTPPASFSTLPLALLAAALLVGVGLRSVMLAKPVTPPPVKTALQQAPAVAPAN